MTQNIELKNVGPVQHLAFRTRPGVIVLKARNGTGKTQTLKAVEAAVSGDKMRTRSLAVKDGEVGGEVEACGVTIRLGKNNRRSGELEVDSIEGKLNVADLVDPGLVDQAAADGRRLKALVNLSGVKGGAAHFYDLAGGKAQLEALVDPEVLLMTDLVQQAEAVKRSFDAAARKEEGQATLCEGKARGLTEAANEVQLPDDPSLVDGVQLQLSLEEALQKEATLQQQALEHSQAKARQDSQKQELMNLQQSPLGHILQGAQQGLEEAKVNHGQLATRVKELEGQVDEQAAKVKLAQQDLDKLQQALVLCKQQHQAAAEQVETKAQTVDTAQANRELLTTLEAQVNEALPPEVSAADLVAAKEVITKARQAIEHGALCRNAVKQLAEADGQLNQAQQHLAAAQSLRSKGGDIDQVLSVAVAKACEALRVEAGRLVLTTDRGTTFFAELSQGERWTMALDLAIDQLGPDGILVIPQEAWEGLDDINRAAIADHVKARQVVVLTAECSLDEQVTAEVYGEPDADLTPVPGSDTTEAPMKAIVPAADDPTGEPDTQAAAVEAHPNIPAADMKLPDNALADLEAAEEEAANAQRLLQEEGGDGQDT